MTTPELDVLLIEDNPDDAELVAIALGEGGGPAVRLRSAARLQDGLDALEDGPPDVVLLDLSLPDTHGLETLRTFHHAAPHVPVVVLTGLEDGAVASEALQRGAQDYLVKGRVDPDTLARSVRYAIDRKKAEALVREQSLARPLVRRIVQALVGELNIATPVLRRIGRALSKEATGGTMVEHLESFVSMGLGQLTLTETSDEARRFEFQGEDLLEQRPDSAQPTCAMTLGFLEGIVSEEHGGQETLGTEFQCQSQGADRCTFLVELRGDPRPAAHGARWPTERPGTAPATSPGAQERSQGRASDRGRGRAGGGAQGPGRGP